MEPAANSIATMLFEVGAVADGYRRPHQVLAAEPLVFLDVSTPPPPAFSAERSTVDPI